MRNRLVTTFVLVSLLMIPLALWGCAWGIPDLSDLEDGWADDDIGLVEATQAEIDRTGDAALDAIQTAASGAMHRVAKNKGADPGDLARVARLQRDAVRAAYAQALSDVRTRFAARRGSIMPLSEALLDELESPVFTAMRQVRDRALQDLLSMQQGGADAPRTRAATAGDCLLRFTDPRGQFDEVAIARLTSHRNFRVTGELLVDRVASHIENPPRRATVEGLGARFPVRAMRWFQSGDRIVLIGGTSVLELTQSDASRRRFETSTPGASMASMFVGAEPELGDAPALATSSGRVTLRRSDP